MIIEYTNEYKEDAQNLLVELEEYLVSLDRDNLEQVGINYKEKMIKKDLTEIKNNNGKCYLALDDNKVVGMIMGIIRHYDESDYLDYKCPKMGIVTELIVTSKVRSKGIGHQLLNKLEDYFKTVGCEYISLEVFSYNNNGKNFYNKNNYHPRCEIDIKKI